MNMTECAIFKDKLYVNGEPVQEGVLDSRMGLNDSTKICVTCKKDFLTCPGHFGHFNLKQTVFHSGYFKRLLKTLKCFCFECGKLMIYVSDYKLKRIKRNNYNLIKMQSNMSRIEELVKQNDKCAHCGEIKPKIKRVAANLTKINIYFKSEHQMKSRVRNIKDLGFQKSNVYLTKGTQEAPKMQNKKISLSKDQFFRELTPYDVKEIFNKFDQDHWKYFLSNLEAPSPFGMLVETVPVPPLCIRPTVKMTDEKKNEDDATIKIFEMIKQTESIILTASFFDAILTQDSFIKQGRDLQRIDEQKYLLQVMYNQYINSESSEAQDFSDRTIGNTKGILQRLKGKTGRFRGNLSGKRVEYSSRTVISPDPNLEINEVGVPIKIAMILTFPEEITPKNFVKLKKLVGNGPFVYPGANLVTINRPNFVKENYTLFSRHLRMEVLEELKVGDIVHRHIVAGDYCLFNRQPSLHKQSIMGFFVKISQHRTFRFNECVCTPFNADFDGDEMNLHIVQTQSAKAEVRYIMNSKLNLLNIKNGHANIAVIQDFLTTAFLLSSKSNFFDRSSVCSIMSMATRCEEQIDLPLPAIIFPVPLWTGKQIISMIFNPNKHNSPLKFTINIKEKRYKAKFKALHFDVNDGYVSFRNGILLSGQMGKASLGGSKSGLVYRLLKEYSSFVCSKVLVRFSRLSSRLIELMGMTFGISDVTPSMEAKNFIHDLFASKNKEAEKIIKDFLDLEKTSKKSQRVFLEDKLTSVLNASRDEAGKFLTSSLTLANKALIMAQSGAKGSVLNICQMVSTLGQQIVNGKRVQNGFIGRTLPHFKHEDLMPESRGFVFNSFYTGLLPTEFFFHTMAGREGLIDTAVKTADTGYMQRKLVKVMEDLVVEYDYSVRSSEGKLVQFLYGDDGFDPLMAESEEFPVNLSDYQDLFTTQDLSSVGDSKQYKLVQDLLDSDNTENRDLFLDLADQDALWVQKMVTVIEDSFWAPITKIYPKFCRSNLKLNSQLVRIYLCLLNKQCLDSEIKVIFESIQNKMMSVYVHPGEAVGALTAQSLGEPCTQMTLKTFHFAGVASMNVTLGVPRIKEIMNAAENITTPIIEVALKQKELKLAKMIKNQINCVKLVDILQFAEEVINGQSVYLRLVLDQKLMKRCFISTNAGHIKHCLLKAKLKLKPKHVDVENSFELRIQSPVIGKTESFFYLKNLLKKMQGISVYGVPTISRSVINETDSGIKIYAQGTGIREVFGIPEVDFTKTKTNHISEVLHVLGVEAARSCIISQIQYTIGIYGIKVDPRHVALMADVMCFTGKLVGLNRYGIVKMKNSPLMLASFEKTGEILFDSAFFGASDGLKGVTEKILFGTPVALGTGKFEVRLECAS